MTDEDLAQEWADVPMAAEPDEDDPGEAAVPTAPTPDDTPEGMAFPPLPDEFWTARDMFGHIRDAAWATDTRPDYLLYGVLARISAMGDRALRVDAGTGQGSAPLGLYVAFLGGPGDGKTTSLNKAIDLIPDAWAAPESRFPGMLPIGTGPGVVEAFIDEVEVDGDGPNSTRKERRQVRHALHLNADEGHTLNKFMFDTQGSILADTLRTAWSGGQLGQTNATKERCRNVAGRSYTLAFTVGYQPELVEPLLADLSTGLPQRFLWCGPDDPMEPDEDDRPTDRGPLVWDHTVLRRPHVIRFEPHITQRIRRQRTARRKSKAFIDTLDGQEDLMLIKLAGVLALMRESFVVGDEDWRLAHIVWAHSRAVRERCVEAAQRNRMRMEEERRERDSLRAVATKLVVDSTDDSVRRIAEYLAGRCRERGMVMSRRDQKDALKHRDRVYLDAAIEHAVREGLVRRSGSSIAPPLRDANTG